MIKKLNECTLHELASLSQLTLLSDYELKNRTSKYPSSEFLRLIGLAMGVIDLDYSGYVYNYINKSYIAIEYNLDKIVGWSAIYPRGSIITTAVSLERYVGVYVHYKYRRKGIGTKLLKQIKFFANRRGYEVFPGPFDKKGLATYNKAKLGKNLTIE